LVDLKSGQKRVERGKRLKSERKRVVRDKEELELERERFNRRRAADIDDSKKAELESKRGRSLPDAEYIKKLRRKLPDYG
ncbi:hypothetical protein A2U01_0060257, partial [Trifolium medium]|nr:hypothetical protein [Trifolium medium]